MQKISQAIIDCANGRECCNCKAVDECKSLWYKLLPMTDGNGKPVKFGDKGRNRRKKDEYK